ncbi:MAG: carbon-nitrogen hydrolase family protein [Chloroflexota bacterium]
MTFRIAACQMQANESKDANFAAADRLIDEAASLGAEMVALPEMFNQLAGPEDLLAGGEPIPGPTSNFLADKARQRGIHIHGGSFMEQVEGKDKVWNTTLVFDPEGNIVSKYRKIHLFDIQIADKVVYQESSIVEAGEEMVTFETDHGHFGLTICYDLRFPELYRALTLAGARVVFQPAAFALYTGKDHWEPLIRARAIENQVYMVSPSQIGTFGNGNQCYGSSMIVDPWGTVLARAPERECVIIADIDYDAQDQTRQTLPALKHRRPDVYEPEMATKLAQISLKPQAE